MVPLLVLVILKALFHTIELVRCEIQQIPEVVKVSVFLHNCDVGALVNDFGTGRKLHNWAVKGHLVYIGVR